MNYSIFHIINPINIDPNSDLYLAQPVTFESLRRARAYSGNNGISIVSAQFDEDHSVIPSFIKKTTDLERSIIDLDKSMKRKLPLIADIINKAFEESQDGDYIIYSNVDIAVMPFFYDWIKDKIDQGVEAFVINRRTISEQFNKPDQLNFMYSQIGEIHPGYDCFVFKRDLVKKMIFGSICIGAIYIGLAFYINLSLFAPNFKEYGEEHLTFHIGNDQIWKSKDNDSYAAHNKRELDRIKEILSAEYSGVENIIKQAFPTIRNQNK